MCTYLAWALACLSLGKVSWIVGMFATIPICSWLRMWCVKLFYIPVTLRFLLLICGSWWCGLENLWPRVNILSNILLSSPSNVSTLRMLWLLKACRRKTYTSIPLQNTVLPRSAVWPYRVQKNYKLIWPSWSECSLLCRRCMTSHATSKFGCRRNEKE